MRAMNTIKIFLVDKDKTFSKSWIQSLGENKEIEIISFSSTKACIKNPCKDPGIIIFNNSQELITPEKLYSIRVLLPGTYLIVLTEQLDMRCGRQMPSLYNRCYYIPKDARMIYNLKKKVNYLCDDIRLYRNLKYEHRKDSVIHALIITALLIIYIIDILHLS